MSFRTNVVNMVILGTFRISKILLMLMIIVRDCDSQIRTGIECDENVYYAPYVKIRRTRSGGNLASLDQTGFIDTSYYIDAVLCINGPAVLLKDFEEKTYETEKNPVPTYYNPKIEIFSHACKRINKLATSELQRLREAGLSIRVTKDVHVIGLKVAGVQLVGEYGDYMKPTPAWFRHERYGHVHRHDMKVTDGSFAVIGYTEAFCLDVDSRFRVNIVSKAKTGSEICFWSIERSDDHFDRYEQIFRAGRKVEQYRWVKCPPRVHVTSTTAAPDPNQSDAKEYDPFAIIDPHNQSSINERPKIENYTLNPDETFENTDEIKIEYRVEATACHPLPMINKTGCPSSPTPPGSDDHVELFYQALLLPPDYPKEFPENLQWKDDILSLVAEVFNKICEPMPYHFAFTVFRVLELYLIKAHENDDSLRKTRHVNWDVITSDLNICKKHADLYIWFAWNITSTGGSSFNRKRKRRSTSYSWEYEDSKYDERMQSHSESREYHHHHHRHRQSAIKYQENFSSNHNFLSELESDFHHSMESLPESQRYKKAALTHEVPLELPSKTMFPEYFFVKRKFEKDFRYYPIGVRHVNKQLEETDIYYFADTAEFEYELNSAIDFAWKVWATVAGYCNQHYPTRQSETFPRFQSSFHEDFLEPVDQQWKHPLDNEVVKTMLSKFNDETVMAWLDTCLEAAYIDSKTRSYRPPRPLKVFGPEKAELLMANSLLEIPTEILLAQNDIDSVQKLPKERTSNVPEFSADMPVRESFQNKNLEPQEHKKRKYKEGVGKKREKWISL